MGELPSLSDGLTGIQRAILQTLARGRTVRSNQLLEAILGGIAPSLESKLIGGASGESAERDPYLETYLALAELAQPFRTRYPLVVGQGNFGTLDGDPPADAVFTQCRVSAFGAQAARGVAPTLLVNGATGVSGDGTFQLLPHRLGEVLNAAAALIRDPRLSDEELDSLVPGPDFPGGGIVSPTSAVHEVYRSGAGSLVVRGRARIENAAAGPAIVVTEIPFSVSKSRIAQEASRGIRDGVLRAIADVLDESDAAGIRIVFPLRSGAAPEEALGDLFARTSLQATLPVDMRVLVDGAARRVSLPALLRAYTRQLATALAAHEQREPSSERLLRELEVLRTAHDDARRTELA
jgi:DNA gyrase subunit A